MNVSDFDFDLPEQLIAQEPTAIRGASRLLVLNRPGGRLVHSMFANLPEFLRAGDLLVLNNTRVFPARLLGRRVPSGGAVECLLLESVPDPAREGQPEQAPASPESSRCWDALMHPGQKLKPGAQLLFEREGVRLHGEVISRHYYGRRTVRLWAETMDVSTAIEQVGHIPLPPYIKRDDQPSDRERYQTVYARDGGSVAAPTAGLHFTDGLLRELRARGIATTEVTLHVGYGTFKPVRVERIEEHVVDAERMTVPAEAAAALTEARRSGNRIIAVGTTTARALESLAMDDVGHVRPANGETRVFIRPGHVFRLVDGLITNFHLPRSSLLMLVAAFAGRESVLAAYREAVDRKYRFYSYGDAMLIL